MTTPVGTLPAATVPEAVRAPVVGAIEKMPMASLDESAAYK